MAKAKPDDGSLKRLGGGRWQTRDERFAIEPQSGTWVVVDAEQTDELGLPLVRGPFGSLNAAKDAIAAAREAGPAVSPQASRLAQPPAKPSKPAAAPPAVPADDAPRSTPSRAATPKTPPEPRWFQGLEPAEKRRAREFIGRLTRGRRARPGGPRPPRHRGQDPGGRRARRQQGDPRRSDRMPRRPRWPDDWRWAGTPTWTCGGAWWTARDVRSARRAWTNALVLGGRSPARLTWEVSRF